MKNIYADDVYVTGSWGLVGSNFCKYFQDKYALITPEIDKLDIADYKVLEEYFSCMELKAIVNFAALTDVDGAEKEKGDKNGSFWQVNVVGASNLAKLANKMGAQMIQISTDFVFPGNDKMLGPYSEDTLPPDSSDGIGWYGWTKRIAEKEVQKIVSPAIVRIAFPFGDRASSKDYLNKIKSGIDKDYPLFNDQYITPTYMPDLFYAIEKILKDKLTGVFHVATSPVTTPYKIGCRLLQGVDIKEGSIVEFLKREGVAPRPIFGGLDCEKTKKLLGVKFHSWPEGLVAWI